jgi:adiponectin receptor
MYCSTEWVLFYLCGFLVLNVSTTLIMLSDAMMKPAYRHLRAAVFMMGGGFGILPVVHFVFLEDVPPVLPQLWAEMFFYALGAILFAKRFPECKWPGAFDYFLSSHNWLHICVLIACALHYNLTIEMYEWRQTQICPA